MRFSGTILLAAVILVMGGLGGCASDLIEVRKGSEQVLLAEAKQVSNCQSKGEVIVSVLAEVGFISRSVEAVEANLLQLARNAAIDGDGDTVVRGSSPAFGKRTFAIYKCRP